MELWEEDIPGASLHGREPSDLKIPKLNTPLKGKKTDLVARFVNTIIPTHFKAAMLLLTIKLYFPSYELRCDYL